MGLAGRHKRSGMQPRATHMRNKNRLGNGGKGGQGDGRKKCEKEKKKSERLKGDRGKPY